MFDMSGKKVLVTGGSRGIGLGIASVFARGGADVAIAARSKTGLDDATTALARLGPGRIHGVVADVTSAEWTRDAARDVAATFGGIDVLCANAGIFPEADLADMTEDELTTVLDVNVKGTVFAVQACLDALTASGAGRIVITSSITGPYTGFPRWSHYGASKAAQLGFMRTAAIELAPRGITVNAVLPGNVLTEGLADMGDEYLASMTAAIPAGTLGTPDDIGHAVAFLASDEARYVTGQSLVVDGGQLLPESFDAVGH
ncbi:3-oxoacyl-ACP reductase FabG [Rhodococcus rhodnii]|nr:3-oxoacyl-ACP reductase FabG [Rhodococcus rhodnii]TXG88951.1 3-oxoacyl-ACP reductase FabG [Rhodococcus rhodnii]